MPNGFKLPDWLTAPLAPIWESIHYYARGLYRELSTKNVFLWAQAIAFKALVTFVPIVILATGVIGRILKGNDAFQTVARFIREFLPPNQSQETIKFLNELQSASGTIVGIGSIGLFLSAMSLFITLRIAVSNAFEQNWHEQRSLLGGYAFDIRMVLQVGLLFLLTVGLSVVLPPFFNNVFIGELGGLLPQLQWWQQTIRMFLPLLITTVMFFQLYYFVPTPHPRKRSALTGAVVAAVIWEASKQAFTYYATYVGRFDRYATGSEGLSALGNTFGLLVAFVFWVYFSGVLLMLGAIVASLREHRRVTAGHLPGDEPPAEVLPITKQPSPPAHDPADPEVTEPPDNSPETPSQDDPAQPNPSST